MPLDRDLEGVEVEGRGIITDNMLIGNSYSVDNSRFVRVTLMGQYTGPDIMMDDCYLISYAGPGTMVGCVIVNTLYPIGTIQGRGFSAASNPSILDFSADSAATVSLELIAGQIRLDNLSPTNVAQIKMTGSIVTIDSSCTGGTVIVTGSPQIVDNSGGAVTIINATEYPLISNAVWGEDATTYSGTSTMGGMLSRVKTWMNMLRQKM